MSLYDDPNYTRPVHATRRIDSGPLSSSSGSHRMYSDPQGHPKTITRPVAEAAPPQPASDSHPLAAYWRDKVRMGLLWTQLQQRGETELIPLDLAMGLAAKTQTPFEMVAPFHGAVLAGDHRMGTYCARIKEQCWEGSMPDVYQSLITALPDLRTTFWRLRLTAWVDGLVDFCPTHPIHQTGGLR